MSRGIPVFVKKNRKAQKMTQRDLAAKAGVGLRFVREMERGKINCVWIR